MSSKQSTIFSFMPIRQAKKLNPEIFANKFIRIETNISSSIISGLQTQWSNGLDALKTAANTQVTNVYQNPEQVYSDFEGFDLFIEWQVQNINALSKASVTNALLNFLDVTDLSSISSQNKKKLWEAIVVYRIIERSSEIIEECQNVLRVFNLIETIIQSGTNDIPLIELQKLHFATIVLPSSIFPLPFEQVVPKPLPEFPNPAELDNFDQKTFDSIITAKQELEAIYVSKSQEITVDVLTKDQFTGNYRDLTFIPLDRGKTTLETDSTRIDSLYSEYTRYGGLIGGKTNRGLTSSGDLTKISSETKTILQDLKIDLTKTLLNSAIKRLENELHELSKRKSFKKGYLKSRALGSAVVSYNTFPEIEEDTPPPTENFSTPLIKPLGVGDYLIVQQKLIRYEEFDIAHIENILKGEHFNKTHRNLSRSENYSEFETETSELTETDTRTAERFELSNEVEKVIEKGSAMSAGATISAEYGPVSGSATFNYSTYNSSLNASYESSSYAKETVNRALRRIEKRTRQLRSTLTINEQETFTSHGINNSLDPVDHTIGIYYWLDKIYKAKLINIGRRLTYEFMIPEPASFHIFSKRHQGTTNQNYIKSPIDPADSSYYDVPLLSHRDINDSNYHLWCSRYDVTSVTPPPNFLINIGKGIAGTEDGDKATTDIINIPPGYKPNVGTVLGARYGHYVKCVLGEQRINFDMNPNWDNSGTWVPLGNYKETVPISILSHRYYAVNVLIECIRTPELYEQWQLETYNSIMKSYDSMLKEYRDSLDEIGINRDFGQNPALNRELEKTELKKSAIEMFSLQRFENFDAMFDGDISNLPKFAFQDSIEEGKFVKFFEQAFEWENMTYEFYPYFWGKKKNWLKITSLEDTDPLFEKFLKAGFAKVVVPVRPSFLLSVLHYQKTGQIWEGVDQPIIDDVTLASILTDVNEISDYPEGMEMDEWEVRVPTNLVKLRAINPENDPGLPNFE